MEATDLHLRCAPLDHTAPVPIDRPFTTAEAHAEGVSRYQLDAWVSGGALCHPIRGVYHVSQLPHDLALRVACLRLVVPEDCVVTDRTAAWLWGATTALAPNDHLVVPKLSVFSPPGHRLRNGLTAGGERMLATSDVTHLEGLRVTSALRTACDLGRLLHRDQALAAMDALAALRQFSVEELALSVDRFKGYRGVVQFRTLAGYVDPAAGSPGESILRLRWIDLGIPRPECQIRVPAPGGGSYFLDMGLRDRRLGAEYDGEEFHTEADAAHDTGRRDWMRCEEDWIIVVARAHNVHGRDQDIDALLRAANRKALTRPKFA